MTNYNKKFTTNYIRNKWLNFFEENGYLKINPCSLIPKDDDSLLWINSGVSALKQYFNNLDNAPSRNLVNCQKVIRTNDIDEIDNNSYHQTLFEMLGCFSIDGNSKKKTINFVWEFLTSENYLFIQPSCLFITVLEDDYETIEDWKNQKNIVFDNIITGSKETNFWDMGDGPCGPNTEIYYKIKDFDIYKKIGIKDIENKDFFIEIINIVNSKFYHQRNEYIPLLKECVDLGAGLERISKVLQNVQNVFQIDIWENSIKWLEFCYKKNNYNIEENIQKLYIICDHIRTSIFAISDGALPNHKKRGYILKKLIKKSYLISYTLQISIDNLLNLCDILIKSNCDFYKELLSNKRNIKNILEKEFIKLEKNFHNYLDIIYNYLDECKEKEIPVDLVFFWYDTLGIPIEIIDFSLYKNMKNFDKKKFNDLLEEQKKRSLDERKAKKISVFKK